MILLETGNRLLADLMRSFVIPDPDIRPAPTEVKLYDFDNSSFLFQVHEDDLTKVHISLYLPCYREIKEKGALKALQTEFGALLQDNAESGYDATIILTKNDYAGKEDQMIDLVSRFKRIALGGVFEYFLAPLSRKETNGLTNFKFDLRPDTTVYFIPQNDRVTVAYRLSFLDKADTEIGRVFLREFADPSLRRKLQRAPIVDFDVQPQSVLKAFGLDKAGPNDMGFVAFTLLQNHVAGPLLNKSVENLQVFRNFVQFHLKAAKAFFHSRMRARAQYFVTNLNRAKRNTDTNQPKRITTAAGRVKLV
eukprot:UN01683